MKGETRKLISAAIDFLCWNLISSRDGWLSLQQDDALLRKGATQNEANFPDGFRLIVRPEQTEKLEWSSFNEIFECLPSALLPDFRSR